MEFFYLDFYGAKNLIVDYECWNFRDDFSFKNQVSVIDDLIRQQNRTRRRPIRAQVYRNQPISGRVFDNSVQMWARAGVLNENVMLEPVFS